MKKPFLLIALLSTIASSAMAQLTSPPSPLPSSGPGLAPGLYVQVIDGIINVANKGGATNFAAGQFGYTASPIQVPVVVPKNPGIQFTPPPAFSAPPTAGGSSTSPKSNSVDCEVR